MNKIVFLLSCFIGSVSAGDFTHTRYDDMKTDFLNVVTTNIKIVDMNEMSAVDPNVGMKNGANTYGLDFDDKSWTGINSWCTNEYSETAFCFTADGTVSGSASKTRLWIGTDTNRDHVADLVFGIGATEKPVNRFCIEFEMDAANETYFTQSYADVPARAQITNPLVAHDDLEHHEVSLGTYTSPFIDDTRSIEKETSGTFNSSGNTHFYHQGYAYGRFSNIRTFALSAETFVSCFGPNPRGVRSGGRPPWNSNPLMTVVGDNPQGETDAYSYWNYVTRFYWDLESDHNTSYTFPFTRKINKFWFMYEDNDVFAYEGNGSVLGTDIVETGNTATYPFIVDNDAGENRDYQISFMAGGNGPLDPDRAGQDTHFRVYVDENQDQAVDGGDTEVFSFDTITLTASTNKHFLIQHTPNFSNTEQTEVRWSRNFAPGNVLLQEVDRMRYASYSVRTWEGSAADVTNKATILPTIVYQAADSDYLTYAAFNQDKESIETIDNVRLTRYSPDFLRVFAPATVVPKAPTSVILNAAASTYDSAIIVSWTPPTLYNDESSLPAENLKEYVVRWSCDASGGGSQLVADPNVSVSLTDKLLGNCDVTVDATDTSDLTSAESTTTSGLINLPAPASGGFR